MREHIKKVAGTPEWYHYDFSIAIDYLKFVLLSEEDGEDIINHMDELLSMNIPTQAIVQDAMARL